MRRALLFAGGVAMTMVMVVFICRNTIGNHSKRREAL